MPSAPPISEKDQQDPRIRSSEAVEDAKFDPLVTDTRRSKEMTDEPDSRDWDGIRVAEHVILHQLVDLYPAHLTLEELTGIVVDRRTAAHDVQDALRNLTAQRLVHRQEAVYWLKRPVAYIAEIDWAPGVV
jgi:hypothetical protein